VTKCYTDGGANAVSGKHIIAHFPKAFLVSYDN
jgi:hypothetical protein